MEALAALLCLPSESFREADFATRWGVDVFLCKNALTIKQTDEFPVRLDAIISYFEYIFDDQTPRFKMADDISRVIKTLCASNKEAVMVGGRLTSSTGGLILQIVVLY